MRLMMILAGLLLAWVSTSSEVPAVPAVSVPFRSGEIAVDGTLGDTGWEKAAKIELTALPLNHQSGDSRRVPPTTVLLTYDENFLYIAFLCDDVRIVSAGEKYDDALHAGDVVETFVDGIGDHRQFFEIQQNASGLVRDVNYLFTGFNTVPDENGYLTDWNNIWDDLCCNIRNLRFGSCRMEPGGSPNWRFRRRNCCVGMGNGSLRRGWCCGRISCVWIVWTGMNRLRSVGRQRCSVGPTVRRGGWDF